MDYVKLTLLGLQLIKYFIDKAEAKGQFDAGAQAEIAKSNIAILRRTTEGKRLMEKIDAMGEGELDDLESQLTEPEPGKG